MVNISKEYLALRCDQNHNSDNICCLPLQASHTTADVPPQCSPGNNDVDVVTRTGNSDGNGNDDFHVDFEEDFDDLEECDDETTQVPSTHTAPNTATATHTSAPYEKITPMTYVGGYATYYYEKNHTGACGQRHSDSELVVAMDSRIFHKNLCGKEIEVSANGKSVTVKIVDDCAGCLNENCTDLSVAAFERIAPKSLGMLHASWHYL